MLRPKIRLVLSEPAPPPPGDSMENVTASPVPSTPTTDLNDPEFSLTDVLNEESEADLPAPLVKCGPGRPPGSRKTVSGFMNLKTSF
jgi:hypothetical protein